MCIATMLVALGNRLPMTKDYLITIRDKGAIRFMSEEDSSEPDSPRASEPGPSSHIQSQRISPGFPSPLTSAALPFFPSTDTACSGLAIDEETMMLYFLLQDPVVVPTRTDVCSKSFVLLLEFYSCEIFDFSSGKSQARVGATGKSTAKGKTTSCSVFGHAKRSCFFSHLSAEFCSCEIHPWGSSGHNCKYSRFVLVVPPG